MRLLGVKARRWSGCLSLVLCGCASASSQSLQSTRKDGSTEIARADQAADGDEKLPLEGKPVTVEDTALGLKFELPALDDGWQIPREGRGARRGNGVQVEVGSFALPREATAASCRDSARARLTGEPEKPKKPADKPQVKMSPEGKQIEQIPSDQPRPEGDKPKLAVKDQLREQAVGDWPTATWSFTRGDENAPLRSRWAFYPRGSDCLLLEVSGPRGARFPDLVFQAASRTFTAIALPPDRQREVDLIAGMRFLENRDAPAALERFELLANREPTFAKAHFGALMAGFDIGPPAYVRALPHGLAALRAEKDLSGEQRQLALRAVGVMQLAESQLRGAAATLAELVVRVPDLAEGQYNYACALARLGDNDGAIDHLRQAFRFDQDLVKNAAEDEDLKSLRPVEKFQKLLKDPPPPAAKGKTPAEVRIDQPEEDDE